MVDYKLRNMMVIRKNNNGLAIWYKGRLPREMKLS